ncbi:EF-hand domain-containing protein [Bosea sp. (in: a-proteobacteria)]|jgi:Ca2+-binding EF-hand superfamily protein|uniref:EF-hand domain-containing protein n=1 Tax=Bosea sp. (in: a-proteobacteria) TaxID=1871050 RepID=UPI002DDCE2BA|nr:EF-hand domain-containing protein [Bosea sp. (in: a-proteobacteria)]HEV2509820.1 EF-hand domain-containing protein [Bosea sp. (in: a-proteobacteria)]
MTSISGAGGFRPPPPGKPPSFDKLDGNSDGVLNLAEFSAGAPKGADNAKTEKLFKAMDTDQDGSVSKAESDAFKAKAEKADQQMQAVLLMLQSDTASTKADAKDGEDKNYFAKLDADSDGSVAKDEFLKVVAPDGDSSNGLLSRLFAAMDADKDGKISKEEMADFKKQMEERTAQRPPPPPPPAEVSGATEAYGQTYQLGAKASAGTTYSQAA